MTTTSNDIEFAYLNDLVEEYDESPFDGRMRGYMMRTLEPWLRSGKCLQMGCYKGDLTALLVERYGHVTVVDAAQRFLDHTAERIGRRGTFHCSLFEDFHTDERFDTVFLVHVLEHVEDAVGTLRQIRSLLTETGRLYVIVPNANAASRQIAVKMNVLSHNAGMTEADERHGHRRIYALDTLEGHVREAGLKIEDSGGIFFKPLANFQFDKLAGTPVLTEGYMEGCFQLGRRYPDLCASVYAVAGR
jgi:2-polyprenyl-3-methyl-5-hydroxy-6-metoxy-1,4-benzoquinol methylase